MGSLPDRLGRDRLGELGVALLRLLQGFGGLGRHVVLVVLGEHLAGNEDIALQLALRYEGILPDLFKEGKGVVAQGQLQGDVFIAREVLAKHDENYMPPEAADALKRAQQGNPKLAESMTGGPVRK